MSTLILVDPHNKRSEALDGGSPPTAPKTKLQLRFVHYAQLACQGVARAFTKALTVSACTWWLPCEQLSRNQAKIYITCICLVNKPEYHFLSVLPLDHQHIVSREVSASNLDLRLLPQIGQEIFVVTRLSHPFYNLLSCVAGVHRIAGHHTQHPAQ